MRQFINIIIICSFIYFCVVQFNDPDGWLWIIIYSVPILLGIAALAGKSNFKLTRIAFYLFLIISLTQITTLFSWIKMGTPDFIDYKPTDIQIAEEMRELIGLLLNTIAIGVLHFQNRSAKKNP